MFIIFKRLDGPETKKLVEQLEEWFKANPRRRVCNADMGGIRIKARRKSIKADVIEKVGTTYD